MSAASMSDVLHRLAGLGLDVRGVPPTMAVVVRVAGTEASVTCDASREGALRLTAETAWNGAPADDSSLAAAALGAPGDTSFGTRGEVLTAARQLVEPSVGAAYDAVFELAKAVVGLARGLEAQADAAAADTVAVAAAGSASSADPRPAPALPPAGGPAGPPHAGVPAGPPHAAAPGPPHAAAPGPLGAPRHVVPTTGLPAYEAPDPARAPTTTLAPGLPLTVVSTSGGWAQVRADNGWIGWVDAAALRPA